MTELITNEMMEEIRRLRYVKNLGLEETHDILLLLWDIRLP